MSIRPAPPGKSFNENFGVVTALWPTMTNLRMDGDLVSIYYTFSVEHFYCH